MALLPLKQTVKSTFMLTSKLLQVVLTYTRLLTLTGAPVILPLFPIRKVLILMSQIIHVLWQSLSSSDSTLVMLSILCLLQFATFLASLSKHSFETLKKLWLFLLSLKSSRAVSLTPEQLEHLLQLEQLLTPAPAQHQNNEEVTNNAEQSFNVRA